jgi:hypothetical protein
MLELDSLDQKYVTLMIGSDVTEKGKPQLERIQLLKEEPLVFQTYKKLTISLQQ